MSANNCSVAIGYLCAYSNQSYLSVAIGNECGKYSQQNVAIAIGESCGQTNQSVYAIGIGSFAGQLNQSTGEVAVSRNAGRYNQGAYAIAIGCEAGVNSQHANSIILNGSGDRLDSGSTNSFYVSPMRDISNTLIISSTINAYPLYYNYTTKEINTRSSQGAFLYRTNTAIQEHC